MVYAPPRRKLTVDEYQQMGADGILGPDERVELLDGELYEPVGRGLPFPTAARAAIK